MFAILAGLMAILVVLGATINTRFDGGSLEKVLVGLLALPMLAFGHSAEFSKGWLMGVASAALIGLLLIAGGLPLLLSTLFLGVAASAFWDREVPVPEVAVVEEYLDDADFTRLIKLGERGLALQLADWLALGELGLQAKAEALLAARAEEMVVANEELQEIFGSLPLQREDLPSPQWVREVACA
jgi:hypothetical protein